MRDYHAHYEYADRSHTHDSQYASKNSEIGCLFLIVYAIQVPIICIFFMSLLQWLSDRFGWEWKIINWVQWVITCGFTYCNQVISNGQ